MWSKDFQIRARMSDIRRCLEIIVFRELPDGKMAVGKPIETETRDNDHSVIEPTIVSSMSAAQQLMDDLWYYGVRPSEGIDNPGELRATKYHLEDMRRVFEKFLKDGGK